MDRLPPVAKWLTKNQDQVLDKFMSLPKAFSDGKGQKRFVFVPGTRDDRCLIVAHADTVWLDEPIQLGYHDNILFSLDRNRSYTTTDIRGSKYRWGAGIGADDRAGCAIAWELRDLGHSILITSGEEQNCISSRRMMNNANWANIINGHTFAVQFDRRGYKDIVFYDVGTNTFVNYVQQHTGYTPARGTHTDIRVLCHTMCGVNISTGYYDEHRPEEKLVIDQWQNTLQVAKSWLTKKLPFFPLDKQDLYEVPHKSHSKPPVQQSSYVPPNRSSSVEQHDDEWVRDWKNRDKAQQRFEATKRQYITTKGGLVEVKAPTSFNIAETRYSETVVSCRNEDCNNSMKLWNWFESNFQCPKCKSVL